MTEKLLSLETDNVFLDTCIFVAENYNSTAYHTLVRLGTIGAVNLKTTDITLREIKRQITEKVNDAIKSLHAKSAKNAVLRNFQGYRELMEQFDAQKQELLATELWKRVEGDLNRAKCETITACEVATGPIFDAYFAQRPPFGPSEKRKEFPDAFVIAALNAWCEKNLDEMHVITIDGTVRQACEALDTLYPLKASLTS